MDIRRAGADDCEALADTSKRAFDADVAVGAPARGGPPGYDSTRWHRDMLRKAYVFAISHDRVVVGGAIVFLRSASVAYLGRIWLVPEVQGNGLGHQAMESLETLFPKATRWQLETPMWNLRNQHFYTSCGYRRVGARGDEVQFEKSLRTGPRPADR